MKERIAVVGSGISGLTTAYLLSRRHDVTLYEAEDTLGGHTNTESITLGGQTWPVNTGFIVFNDWTYPNFHRLLDNLGGIAAEKTEMSFSVKCGLSGLEYCGSNLNTLFAQRRNLLRPRFHRMIREILRFNTLATDLAESGDLDASLTLGAFLDSHGFSDWFVSKYIVPMGAAIWSASEADMRRFQALFFIRFFRNHGLLSVRNRPQWYTLTGGSEAYIEPITRPYRDRIRLNDPVRRIDRNGDNVTVISDGGTETYDQVVLACHSDQALAVLAEPSAQEQAVLGALPYTVNDVILHTDASVLPRRRLAWAAWNYHIPERESLPVSVTYNMNRLQNFDSAPETFCVTLNPNQPIDEQKIIKRFRYSHPVFSPEGTHAQGQFETISGHQRTHYCGAYWFNGFHEDGVNSALRVARNLGVNGFESA